METQSLKEVFFENDDYTLETEPFNNMLVLHCTVRNWTASSLRHGYNKLGELMNKASDSGYDQLITITPNPKFAKLFGGEVIDKFSRNNEKYEVVRWDLIQFRGL